MIYKRIYYFFTSHRSEMKIMKNLWSKMKFLLQEVYVCPRLIHPSFPRPPEELSSSSYRGLLRSLLVFHSRLQYQVSLFLFRREPRQEACWDSNPTLPFFSVIRSSAPPWFPSPAAIINGSSEPIHSRARPSACSR